MLHSENNTDFTPENLSINNLLHVDFSNERTHIKVIKHKKPEDVLTTELTIGARGFYFAILKDCSQDICTDDMLRLICQYDGSRYRAIVNELCCNGFLTHFVICNTDLYLINRFMVSKKMRYLKTALKKRTELD